MKRLFLTLSLLFSVNLFCEYAWITSGPTYEDILWSYNIPDLEKEKSKVQNELDRCSDSTKQSELQSQLRSVERTITCMKKAAEKEINDYRKEVQGFSLKELELEKNMCKRSLETSRLTKDDVLRQQTNAIVRQELAILEAEIEKREQAQ